MQRFLEALRKVPRSTLSCGVLPVDLIAAFGEIAASEVGLVAPPAPSALVRSAVVAETAAATLSIFELGASMKIPLHGHPGAVLTKVLFGRIQVAAFTLDATGASLTCTRNEVIGAGGIAVTERQRDNVHALRNLCADEEAVVLDLIAPPYSSDLETNYYYAISPHEGARIESPPLSPFSAVVGTSYRACKDEPLDFTCEPMSYGGPAWVLGV